MISIRPLRRSDRNFVLQMTQHENWMDLPCDINRCVECACGEGCFVAEIDGKQAGHVFSFNYGRIGWIGLLIVKTEYRKRGIATTLMKEAINYMFSHGVETIKLDAVQSIADLYRKLGFTDECDSIRFARIGKRGITSFSKFLEHMKEEELEQIAEFDAQYFGVNRLKVLDCLFRDYPEYCFVSRSMNKINGYIMARKTESGFWIGPWVCNPQNYATAKKLITSCINSFDENGLELRVGIPSVNSNATRLLQSLEFKEVSKSIRMVLGKRDLTGNFLGVYGIAAPEKG